MFRIGEFSRLARVTIETLRHHDAMGLLAPVHVDPTTGYRYYSARQLVQLNRILSLKELGFSLEEIRRILQDGLTGDQLRGMFMLQQAIASWIEDNGCRISGPPREVFHGAPQSGDMVAEIQIPVEKVS